MTTIVQAIIRFGEIVLENFAPAIVCGMGIVAIGLFVAVALLRGGK